MLRKIRERRELKQGELAELAGVDNTIISKLERGEIKNPSWKVVGRLARALQVHPEEIYPLEFFCNAAK